MAPRKENSRRGGRQRDAGSSSSTGRPATAKNSRKQRRVTDKGRRQNTSSRTVRGTSVLEEKGNVLDNEFNSNKETAGDRYYRSDNDDENQYVILERRRIRQSDISELTGASMVQHLHHSDAPETEEEDVFTATRDDDFTSKQGRPSSTLGTSKAPQREMNQETTANYHPESNAFAAAFPDPTVNGTSGFCYTACTATQETDTLNQGSPAMRDSVRGVEADNHQEERGHVQLQSKDHHDQQNAEGTRQYQKIHRHPPFRRSQRHAPRDSILVEKDGLGLPDALAITIEDRAFLKNPCFRTDDRNNGERGMMMLRFASRACIGETEEDNEEQWRKDHQQDSDDAANGDADDWEDDSVNDEGDVEKENPKKKPAYFYDTDDLSVLEEAGDDMWDEKDLPTMQLREVAERVEAQIAEGAHDPEALAKFDEDDDSYYPESDDDSNKGETLEEYKRLGLYYRSGFIKDPASGKAVSITDYLGGQTNLIFKSDLYNEPHVDIPDWRAQFLYEKHHDEDGNFIDDPEDTGMTVELQVAMFVLFR